MSHFPLFAGIDLAGRVERADASLIAEAAEAAQRRDPRERVYVLPLAGGVAVWAGEGSPLNKVAGLGFAGPLAEEHLAQVERAFAERGAPVQIELSTLAEAGMAALLTRRGYQLVGFENVLGLPLPAPAAPPVPGVEIAESGMDEIDTWLDVVVTGFAHPDDQGVASHEQFPREVLERVIGDLGLSGGFRRFLARRGDEPAGGASLRISEGVAQLAGAATLPGHRRRGVQSALTATRLALAAAEGCDVAVVTTQPGSKSQQNVQRQGFQLLYSRAILVREP